MAARFLANEFERLTLSGDLATRKLDRSLHLRLDEVASDGEEQQQGRTDKSTADHYMRSWAYQADADDKPAESTHHQLRDQRHL